MSSDIPESCTATSSTFSQDDKSFSSCYTGFRIFRRQFTASFGALVGSVSIGMVMALKSYVMGENVVLPGTITTQSTFMMSSWVSVDPLLKSLPNIVLSIGRLFGVFLSGWIMRRYGRKVTMLFSDMPILIGWLSLTTTNDFWMSIFGCFSAGYGSGLFLVSSRVYVLEICSPHYRGLVSTLLYLCMQIGMLLSDFLVFNLTWRYAFAMFVFIPLLSLQLNLNCLESPYFLIFMENREESEKNFYKLRGRSLRSVEEMELMLSKATTNVIIRDGRSAMINLLSSRFLRPLLMISLFFLSMASANMERKMEETNIDQKPKPENSNFSILEEHAPPILVYCFSSLVITFMKRRHIYFATIGGIFMCQILAIFAHDEIFSTLKILSLFFGLTAVPLFWLMASEMIPSVVRDVGYGFIIIWVQFLTTILPNAHEFVLVEFGENITFLIKACAIFISSALLFFILPETKDTTLQDIEDRRTITEIPNLPVKVDKIRTFRTHLFQLTEKKQIFR